jgi:hypothetical protein
VGVLGMLLGAMVAVLVPFVVLKFGSGVNMGSFAATILVISGVTGGVILAVASAFFAIVIPTHSPVDRDRRDGA